MGFSREVVQMVYMKKTIELTELTGGKGTFRLPVMTPLGGSIHPISCMNVIKLKRRNHPCRLRKH